MQPSVVIGYMHAGVDCCLVKRYQCTALPLHFIKTLASKKLLPPALASGSPAPCVMLIDSRFRIDNNASSIY